MADGQEPPTPGGVALVGAEEAQAVVDRWSAVRAGGQTTFTRKDVFEERLAITVASEPSRHAGDSRAAVVAALENLAAKCERLGDPGSALICYAQADAVKAGESW